MFQVYLVLSLLRTGISHFIQGSSEILNASFFVFHSKLSKSHHSVFVALSQSINTSMALPRSSEVFLLSSALILDPCSQCCLCTAFSISFSLLPRCLISGCKKWALSQTGKWIISQMPSGSCRWKLKQAGPGQEKSTDPQPAGCSSSCPWQRGHIFQQPLFSSSHLFASKKTERPGGEQKLCFNLRVQCLG